MPTYFDHLGGRPHLLRLLERAKTEPGLQPPKDLVAVPSENSWRPGACPALKPLAVREVAALLSIGYEIREFRERLGFDVGAILDIAELELERGARSKNLIRR